MKPIKAREAGGSRIHLTNVKANGFHPLRGFNRHLVLDLGLTPQALRCRPLRGLKQLDASSILMPSQSPTLGLTLTAVSQLSPTMKNRPTLEIGRAYSTTLMRTSAPFVRISGTYIA